MIQLVENGEEYFVTVNGQQITVRSAGSLSVDAGCHYRDLGDETGVDFPECLNIDIDIEDEFNSFPFRRVAIYRLDGPVILEFECDDSDTCWQDGPRIIAAIEKQLEYHERFTVDGEDHEGRKLLYVRTVVDPTIPLRESIVQAVGELSEAVKEAECLLSGIAWKEEYEEDADVFSVELLAPLLKRMGFVTVRYNDVREHGKDFTFSEWTPFGDARHYGLLALAGDLSGEDDSAIDKIIEHVRDAFSTPYLDGDSVDPCYLSSVVIAISGRFTENAKVKIVEKVPKGLIGSLVLVDQERLVECIEHYWLERE